MAELTADERQRLLLATLLSVHDCDSRRLVMLLAGLPAPELRMLVRSLAEAVVAWQVEGEG
jgi:hypothetical protein